MARVDLTQSQVLQAIVAHLRDTLDLNNRNCYESLMPDAPPTLPVGGEIIVSVAPGEGQFVEGEQQVGNITEEWTIIVTAYSRIRLASTDHDFETLQDDQRGLLEMKRKVLQALCGDDPTTDDEDANTFVRQLLYAIRADRPQHDRDKEIGWISIIFGVDFDWDLT